MACPQLHNTRDLICKDGSCENPNQRCVTSAVIDVWKKAGFENYVISGSAVREKILKLHHKYKKLKDLKSLNWNSSADSFVKIQKEFVEESARLLDISVAKFEEKILSDRMRSQEAKEEDIQFFQDQKGERHMYISEELDEEFERSVKRKEDRYRRMKEAREREQETREQEQEAKNSVEGSGGEVEVSFDASSESEAEKNITSTDDDDYATELPRQSGAPKSKVTLLI